MIPGFFERLEVSDSFVLCDGWVSLSALPFGDKDRSFSILLKEKGHSEVGRKQIDRLYDRSDLTEIPEAKAFSLIIPISRYVEPPNLLARLWVNDQEVELSILQYPIKFKPKGALEVIPSVAVLGWIFDPDAFKFKTKPHILIDNEIHIEIDLLESRDDVPSLFSSEQPTNGFRLSFVDLSRLAYGSNSDFTLGDGKEHSILLLSDQFEIDCKTFRYEHDGRGKLERFDGQQVIGWASNGRFVHQTAMIEILINGTRYATAKASIERKDLIAKGVVPFGGGFHFEVPEDVPAEANEISLSARFFGTNIELAGTPINISGRHAKRRDYRHFLTRSPTEFPQITIIVPIYNAADQLELCVSSVVHHTSGLARLLLIDDASPDPRIREILARWKGWDNIEILYNKKNLGFTKTVNRGIKHAATDDVVFLNSDTIVTEGWLEGLRLAAYSDRNIATATPLSNNAGAFSVPEIGVKNDFPPWLEIEDCGRLIRHASAALMPVVPTGNGFCMFVKRTCIDDIGPLDEEAFPRGYGEENDFCMRAHRAGYLNVVDDRTFIFHKRAASFLEEKTSLYELGRNVINSRYPEYSRLTSVYSEDPDFRTLRWRARHALSKVRVQGHIPLPRILFVISTQTGGTPQTNMDLMEALSDRYEPWVLRSDSKSLELSRFQKGNLETAARSKLDRTININSHASADYDEQILDWLIRYSFEIVHVRHIAWHGLGLLNICKRLNIPLVFSFHDFYTVCPTIKLLDENQKYCGGSCTSTLGECQGELWPAHTIPPLKHKFIKRWQSLMAQSLDHCDAFVTTSPGTKQVIDRTFPSLKKKSFVVIPHGRDFVEMLQLSRRPSKAEPLKILVPGNISVAKGADFITAVAALDTFKEIEFHILGHAEAIEAQQNIILHGRYKRENFSSYVAKIKPSIGAVFSVWPETYCHTLTEMWACGLPVIAIELGAVGERLREHEAGWLIHPESVAEEVFEKLIELKRDVSDFQQKVSKVLDWQETCGKHYDNKAMAVEYDLLYRQCRDAKRSFRRAKQPMRAAAKVVLVLAPIEKTTRKAPASTHIRISERCKNRFSRRFIFREVDLSYDWKNPNLGSADLVIVQRDFIHPRDVDALIADCRERNIQIVIDIDDDLLRVPVQKDPTGKYAKSAPSLGKLLSEADLVIASTNYLASVLKNKCKAIAVLANSLSAELWLKPLPLNAERITRDHRVGCNILYMGSTTHDDDLRLVAPAITSLSEAGICELHVIGGQSTDLPWFKRIQIPDDAKNYPAFVTWFRKLTQDFDLAIAPLSHDAFNSSKSDLKILDYAAASLPTVASIGVSYSSEVAKTAAILVTESQWQSTIEELSRDSSSRTALARAAYRIVRSQRMHSIGDQELDDLLFTLWS